MESTRISTEPADYLTPEELAEARSTYEKLCARIRRTVSGRITLGTGAKEHLLGVRQQVTASRRPGTASDAAVFELDREWRNIAGIARRETSVSVDVTYRLVELAGKMSKAYEAARVTARAADGPRDELLHTDSAGDRLYAAPPRGKHGTMLFIRPGEGETYLPTPAVDALRAALNGTVTPATRAQVLTEAADVAHRSLHADHAAEGCAACSMASVIEYELRRMADAALTVEQPAEQQLPRTTAGGRLYLRRFAKETVYVFLGASRPGNGVSAPALERLLRDGLARVGDYEPSKGRLIHLTDLGRAVLAANPEVTGD